MGRQPAAVQLRSFSSARGIGIAMSDAGGLHPTHVPTATAPGQLRRSISVDSFVNPPQPRQQTATRSTGGHGLDLTDSDDSGSEDDDPLGDDYYAAVDPPGNMSHFRRSRTTSEPDNEELSRTRATSSASTSSPYDPSHSSVQLPLPSRRKHTSPPPVPPLPAHVITTQQSSANQADFVVAVVGSSGCGKSTLITLALGHNGLTESTVGITIGPAGAGGRFEGQLLLPCAPSNTVICLKGASQRPSRISTTVSYAVALSDLGHKPLGRWTV